MAAVLPPHAGSVETHNRGYVLGAVL